MRELVIMGNYFEPHLNHTWFGIAATVTIQSSHYDRVLHKFFTGAKFVPGVFPDPNGLLAGGLLVIGRLMHHVLVVATHPNGVRRQRA